jgi:hypothetical protein
MARLPAIAAAFRPAGKDNGVHHYDQEFSSERQGIDTFAAIF